MPRTSIVHPHSTLGRAQQVRLICLAGARWACATSGPNWGQPDVRTMRQFSILRFVMKKGLRAPLAHCFFKDLN